MKNPRVMARCNLFGVMKNLEYLCLHQEECRHIAAGRNISIQFKIRGGPNGCMEIKDGRITLTEGTKPSQVILYFTSPEHFNKMVDGEANPIPLKGITKLAYLTGPFARMSEILATYLRPSPEDLLDPEFFRINTEMTAYAAFYSLAEIANHDSTGKQCSAHIPDGLIQIDVEDGPGIHLSSRKGKLTAGRGKKEDPRAVLGFDGLQTAHNILNGKEDTFTCIALGKMKMKGFIPMIEHMNPILDLVPLYLS